MTHLISPRRLRRVALATSAVALAAACIPAPPPPPAAPPPSERAAGVITRVDLPPAQSATPDTVDLVVAATTDVHGRVRAWDYYANAADPARGLTLAATIVDSLRREAPGRVVLVDAGDLLQGNPFTYVAARVTQQPVHPVVAAMNALRYDAAAIGNHEFNYGIPLLDRAAAQATFPFLGANIYRARTRDRAYPGWVNVPRASLRVGIVGATTPGVAVWDRDNVAGRLDFGDIVPAVREAVAQSRAAGAHVVVVVLHSGLDEPASYDTVSTGVPSENVALRVAREVPGVDAIVFGHSHKELADSVVNGVLLVQAKNWAASVAVAHIGVEREPSGARRVVTRRGEIVRAAGHPEEPAVVAAADAGHRAAVAYATTPIGTTAVEWRADSGRAVDVPLTDFVLEVERAATGAQLASTAVFDVGAHLGPGPITVADVARLYPYENTLRVVRITGKQLRDYLEYSARYYRQFPVADGGALADSAIPGYNYDVVQGADYVLDVSRPVGQRVTRLGIGNRPVADRDTFTLALNNYRQTGGGGYAMLRGSPVLWDHQTEIRQLLIDEVRRRGTLTPERYFRRNWRLEPAAAVAAAMRLSRSAADQGGSGGRTAPASVESPAARPGAPANGPRRLRIISTNDFHGALEARADARGVSRGGAAHVAAAIAQAASDCPGCSTLLLDGGDLFQGTPASNLAFGRPIVELYNRMGYAAAALGNHEFDWGVDTLRARMRGARFRIMAANVRYAANDRDVDWIPNDTIVRRGPWRVGVIGVATVATPTTTRAVNTRGLRFDAPAPIVDSIARTLRARGANAIVVVAHAGAFCDATGEQKCAGEIVDLANALTEHVDAIVSGHTHSLVDATVARVPIVQARSSGRAIATIDLDLGTDGRSVASGGGAVRDVVADSLPSVPWVDSLVRRAVARVAPVVNRPIATIADDMPRQGVEYALGDLIADAQRAAGHGDLAVMNDGGIRADLRAGPATYGTLFEVQPFANVLYKVTVRGTALRGYLERLVGGRAPNVHVSGITVQYDPSAPAGSRIRSATLADGRAIDDAATYGIVMNDFMATGGDGFGLARDAISTVPLNIVDLDAFVDYVRARPQPVRAPAIGRLVAVTK